MNKTGINLLILTLFGLLLTACGKPGNNFLSIPQPASIYPAYESTVIPCNIAPLNFMIREEGTRYVVRFAVAGKDSFDVAGNERVSIPLRKWKKLLKSHRGEPMDVCIFVKKASGWVRYEPLRFTIASEPVDAWLAYRLIEPGYVAWGKMGIYQRCLENFDELPVLENTMTDTQSCMNCHSFCMNNPKMMLFHIRKYQAGTLFVKDGQVSKVNTKTPRMISAGV
jgi:hypothetical protein